LLALHAGAEALHAFIGFAFIGFALAIHGAAAPNIHGAAAACA
jgi:hypothetical protein